MLFRGGFAHAGALLRSVLYVSCAFSLGAVEIPTTQSARSLAADLRQISVDPAQTYRVRDITFSRGDIKIYLNEGVFAFSTPVAGRRLSAVFTIEGAEAGDAEVIIMPPQRSERASLASFTKLPNLDEHFTTAIFFFTDDTAREILDQINRSPVREASDLAAHIGERANTVLREVAGQLDVPLAEALLDHHPLSEGLFYTVIGGQLLGAFDVTYDPTQAESVYVGRVGSAPDQRFELWTNFRPRRSSAFIQPAVRIHHYAIEATIHPDLTMNVTASFGLSTTSADGRVIPLALSPRLQVSSAMVDDKPAEVFQRPSQRLTEFGSAETLLLVADQVLTPGVEHKLDIKYAGSVIRETHTGDYFVDDRNSWYPVYGPVSADFDLTFHCPDRLHLVSTGEPVSETVGNGIRTVHRRTVTPAALAGFNLGTYAVKTEQHHSYSIEIDAPAVEVATFAADPALASETGSILDAYTAWWKPLAQRSLAVSPIAGYFGQGFPGLIYLSTVSFIKQENRSVALRGSRFDAFFSELLLPHEIAHQWWGNIVRQADYRSGWITEAMANLSALEYVGQANGAPARYSILDSYRQDLVKQEKGHTVESAGPVDFGDRLMTTHGLATWHTILYEKGSWILEMLRARLGDQNFRQMQLHLLEEFAHKPLSNEDFRITASHFVPPGQPDRTLAEFFETWVYGTGLPNLKLHDAGGRSITVEVSGVDDDFLAEIPLRCKGASTYWVRAGSGSNVFELPKTVSACQLPSAREFLFTSHPG